MKLDVLHLPYSKEITFSENVVFDTSIFTPHLPLIKVIKCNTIAKVERFEEFIYVKLNIDAKVILQCSYSLKKFETKIKGSDELHFSSSVEDINDEDFIYFKGSVINLDEFIYNLLSASIPLSPKAPGAKIINNGKGYRIISDEDLVKEKNIENKNSPFDALKDLDLN